MTSGIARELRNFHYLEEQFTLIKDAGLLVVRPPDIELTTFALV